MDIFFADPSEVPLPPTEVRIRELNVEPWPDGKRLHVYLEVEPFQKRPNAELTLLDQDGHEITSVSIIQSMTRKIELVMHLRGAVSGLLTLHASLYYSDLPPTVAGVADPGSSPADPVSGPADPGSPPADPYILDRQIVDTRQVTFGIPG